MALVPEQQSWEREVGLENLEQMQGPDAAAVAFAEALAVVLAAAQLFFASSSSSCL